MAYSRRPVSSDLRFKLSPSRADASFSPDLGPVQRWQHAGRILEPTRAKGGLRARAMEESVLDALTLRRVLSPLQRQAGLRLRADFLAAGMGAHLAASYNPASVVFSVDGAFRDRSDREEEAYQRWRIAVKAVGGALVDVIVSVACCDEAPAPEHEAFLKIGLAKLVLHYGLSGLDEDVDEAPAGQMALLGEDEGAGSRRLLH